MFLFIIVALALLWIGIRLFERTQLFKPAKEIKATPSAIPLRCQPSQWLSDGSVQISGWWIPARNPKGTIIFCHGNAGNIGDNLGILPYFNRRHWNVLLWDYRGYGESKGWPSETGIYADARGAFDTAKSAAPSVPIIVYGHSLGGAVAVQMALDRPVDGLIVDGSFASVMDMAKRLYPSLPPAAIDKLISIRFDSLAKAPLLPDIPKLFAHSPHDTIVPYDSGRQLYAAATPPKLFVQLPGTHADGMWSAPGTPPSVALDEFLKNVIQLAREKSEKEK